MRKLCFSVAVLASIASANVLAQDIHFSQFYEHTMLRNPALTGIFSGDYRVAMGYRNQWASIANPYRTFLLTAEGKSLLIKEVNDYISYGVAASFDKAGSVDLASLQIMPSVSYNKALEGRRNTYLSLGFSGGYVQRTLDPTKMTFASQYIGGSFSQNNISGEKIETSRVSYWDLAAGASINSSLGAKNTTNYYIGVSAYHITEPRQSFGNNSEFVNQSMKWTSQAGFSTYINEHWGVNGHFNYSYQQPYQELLVGGMVRYSNTDQYVAEKNYSLYAGAFYRVGDAIIPTIKLTYMNYSCGISYDVNTSSLRTVSGGQGGFELTLSLRGFIKKEVDKTQCPRFEDTRLYMDE